MKESALLLHISNVQKIEHISGKKYPDIVISLSDPNQDQGHAKIGIEVKTSRAQDWKTLGGSIYESTRVPGVDIIILFFAKFYEPTNIEFRYKRIEDCISDVLITHKPRYKLDMDAEETFFSQSGVSYDELKNSKQPFSLIRPFLKERAGQGADLWWVDGQSQDQLSQIGPQSIRFFGDLDDSEKNRLIFELYILFPKIISNSTKKYKEPALFLVAKYGIISSSLRDMFSAGGRATFKGKTLPKYFNYLIDQLDQILTHMNQMPMQLFEEYWPKFDVNEHKVVEYWLNKIMVEVKRNPECSHVRDQLIKYFTDETNPFIDTGSNKQLSLFECDQA